MDYILQKEEIRAWSRDVRLFPGLFANESFPGLIHMGAGHTAAEFSPHHVKP